MLKTDTHCTISIGPALCHSRSALAISCALLILASTATVVAQSRRQVLRSPTHFTSVPQRVLLQIMRAEDERRWDDDVRKLLSARSGVVRARAALAAGRIGNESAVGNLTRLLRTDDEPEVRAMAAFALGEIESALAAEALVERLKATNEPLLKARSVEALGKITAALPKEKETVARQLGDAVIEVLRIESERGSAADRLTVLLGLTAALRARTSNGGPTIARFLSSSDPRVRADAANTLARLRIKDGNEQLRKLLVSDPDAVVRANAARVLGATEDKAAFEGLLDRALSDKDSRVRVSAIRALASLKNISAAKQLLQRGKELAKGAVRNHPAQVNEILEIATTLGRNLQGTEDQETVSWFQMLTSTIFHHSAPEIEIAFARVSPANYLALDSIATKRKVQEALLLNWRTGSGIAQGLGEIAALPDAQKPAQLSQRARETLRAMLDYQNSGVTINTLLAVHSEYAIPDVLRAYAAFKPNDLQDVLRNHLKNSDVIIRATAAELLGESPLDSTNTQALSEALKVALRDRELNDAALAILDALAKQKNRKANQAIELALDSQDHLVRRKAVSALKANGAGDLSLRVGTVQTIHSASDYQRAIARLGKITTAAVATSKGTFTIQLLPSEAALTVDNFIALAKRGFFNGITIHRVVPNFVIQDGDPRGDGNGGPGYQIRCEINEVPYERGAVGMALSGKDTGGSQWFVTHSAQPHLDGGYTVFGKVIHGMDVVDNIVRGDIIRSVIIRQTANAAAWPPPR